MVTTQMEHYLTFGTNFGHFGLSNDRFRGQKARFGNIGAPKGINLLIENGPKRAPMAQKWVSDVYLVMLGQLDQYVVFGTKSNVIQDFQRGKSALFGVLFILISAPLTNCGYPNFP